ncbi:RWD-domain-containing protein [Coemansia reversa NRRL 1564]|uniref:RWD-domain-containing protein n=1 Tax=Coemansia reversa (strain ATCC 12441 / NRRL 1564) TaxID=763665 RepID=A0A2G5BFA1_COERN|nr:RWD-domain-containing protein [Coemansia reversa NRRL 1564]|eukprot:PIA17690.1 RWD-domain-containing protein [Coemansia reversa NRRL 1564]
MTNNEHYIDEQNDEIEILQSIYPNEFTEHSTDPHKFSLNISIEEEDIRPCNLSLGIEYTTKYPDELPDFTIELVDDSLPAASEIEAVLDDKDLTNIHEELHRMYEKNLGMVMVFGMATDLKEIAVQLLVEKTKELKRLKDARLQKEIEADRAKFVGTLVTREIFLQWKKRFDTEMSLRNTTLTDSSADDSRSSATRRLGTKATVGGKLTGRQLFEQDKSLAASDSTYFADGDASVDTRLFNDKQNFQDRPQESGNV